MTILMYLAKLGRFFVNIVNILIPFPHGKPIMLDFFGLTSAVRRAKPSVFCVELDRIVMGISYIIINLINYFPHD